MKTKKFLLAALAMGAMVACSKSDDLQLTETPGIEMDDPGATNVKAVIIKPGDMICRTSGSFMITTYVEAGSYVNGGSKVEAVIEFETGEGIKTRTVLLSNLNAHSDSHVYAGNLYYTPSVCLGSGNGGWLKFKNATIRLTGGGKWKFSWLDIHMAPPIGNSRVSGDSRITLATYTTLSNNGVTSYNTGNVGRDTITIAPMVLENKM